jgi:RHS repeat-associated protein
MGTRRAQRKADPAQQRYYDPSIGRFLSVDPVAADTVTGWNFNRYNYAANNPYKFTDPDGREVSYVYDNKVTKTPPTLIIRMSMSGTARDELKRLEGSKENYQVIVAPGIDNWYDQEDRVIQINTESDFVIDSTGTAQDPVLNAVHEISHAAEHDRIGDEAFAENRNIPAGSQTSPEEERATNVERQAAEELRRPAREDYQDVRRSK